MERLKEEFLTKLVEVVPLTGTDVLEIGCGSGSRSVAIAERCTSLQALEPDAKLVGRAQKENSRENIHYQQGSAEHLPYENDSFDVSIFTLSLHHIPAEKMHTAIDEVVRVTKTDGHVVFLEPAHEGSYFESEILFDAGDGDERAEKARAYYEILTYGKYEEIAEINDETIFRFDSADDFISTFNPKQNLELLPKFLNDRDFVLNAKRRVSIFKV